MQCHGIHDASSNAEQAEAYASLPVMQAACQFQLTDFDIHRFSHWQHSIQTEQNYLNPFDAVLSAWKLSWSLSCDSFDAFIESASQEFPSQTLQLGDQLVFDGNAFQQKSDQSDVFELRDFSNPCKLRSCINRFRSPCTDGKSLPQKSVRFHEQTSIYLGLENELIMFPTIMDTFEPALWTEKPWSRRPSKQNKGRQQSPFMNHNSMECHPACLRTTDQYYNVPSTWFNQNQPQEDEHEDPEDANHFLHEAPESLQNLYDAIFAEGAVIGPRIHESVFLRSWFIHHLHNPQCFQSRIVEINGHWRHWFNDIISAWRDRILPLEQVIFDVVSPNPPRTGVAHEILFDIILSQGIEAPRRAGLVSICQKDDPAQRVAYAVAVSLSEVTSGHQIVQQAEYLHECNLNDCSIRNCWNRIPFTLEPVHEMQDGDSFIVVVKSVPSSAAVATTAQNLASAASHSISDMVVTNGSDIHMSTQDTNGQAQPDSPYPSPSSINTDDSTMHATIHRLGHVQITGLVRRDTHMHVLHDAARIVGVPVDHFLTFHRLQCSPDDQVQGVDSIILQHYLDIPPGSTEKLVLIDIEMHNQHRGRSHPRAPPVSRQVHRILPTVVRQYILQVTRTDAYCEWHQTECLIYRNRVLWNQQERGPIQVEHGMYFRVVLPPPTDPTWDIGHAIRIFHDAAHIFDFPASGRIAVEILQSGGDVSNLQAPQASEGRNEDSRTQHFTDSFKGADLDGDIDVPMTSDRRRPERPPRPTHDGDETWFWEFGQIFSQQAEEEAIEGEYFLYVQSWYIDHHRRTVCRQPRPIRLDHYWITWLDEFTHTWRDEMIQNVPFSVHIVKPRPPQYRHYGYACHILLEQNRFPGQSAGILTALLAGLTNDGIIQGAFSMPRNVRKQDVIDTLEIEPFCTDRRCIVYHGREVVNLVVATEVDSGFSMRAHIEPPQQQLPCTPGDPPEEPQGYFDDIALMQHPPNTAQTQPLTAAGDQPVQNAHACPGFQFNIHAEEFRPGGVSENREVLHELYLIWNARVFTWEQEAPSAPIITWFVDHRGMPICTQSRRVHLDDRFHEWETIIRATWQDFIDPSVSIEIHVVEPSPPLMEPNIIAHVILVQAPREDWVSCLVTVFDSFLSRRDNHLMRLAVTTHEHIQLDVVMRHCGYVQAHAVPFQGWINGHIVAHDQRWPGRSGDEITVRVNRPVVTLPNAAHGDGNVMLQLPNRKAQPLTLYDKLDLRQNIPIQLLHIGPMQAISESFPSHVLVPDEHCEQDIQNALHEFGFDHHVYNLPRTGFACVVPATWSAAVQEWHYVYFPLQFHDQSEIIKHKDDHEFSEHEHMVLLHSLGFERAVILDSRNVRRQVVLVQYHNNAPALDDIACKSKIPTAWPRRQRTVPHKAFFCPREQDLPSQHSLTWDLTLPELHQFFQSGINTLCTWHTHLQVPEFVRLALNHSAGPEGIEPSFEEFDRLIIYTDGSSKPSNRRKAPIWVQDCDTPDAWAFVVLGEKYGNSEDTSTISFLGWHSQPVLYETSLPHFLGTESIGSEFAEREGLFWSGLWRLGINSNIPTVFRTDSSMTAGQAAGRNNCHDSHCTFVLLRSVFQALSAGLKDDSLLIEHVAGHAGDPWNELADYLAKTEASQGHKLQRQSIDLQKWTALLPFLWMTVHNDAGLPTLVGNGFDITPPKLPPANPVADKPQSRILTTPVQIELSLATFNVGSLFVGPDGYAGKVQYLRDQMRAFKLNIVGLQETRSPAGTSSADDVLRLAGGSHGGQYGIEIWINLAQPIGRARGKSQYLKKSQVQIVHADPRRLFARIEHPALQCQILAMHAPQSGRPLGERKKWWEDTHAIVQKYCSRTPLVVLIDANAKSGPHQPPVVFDNDDACSANTNFFLNFLQTMELCLPCTGHIHNGPTATWKSPDGMHAHRIDYVAVPQSWCSSCVHSSVLEEFDPGNAHDDHCAVGLQLCWHDSVNTQPPSAKGAGFQRNAIGLNRHQIDCGKLNSAPWSADIESHVQGLNSSLLQQLRQVCPSSNSLPKKRCLAGEIWDLRARKLALRKRLCSAKITRMKLQLRFFFQMWKAPDMTVDTIAQHHAYESTNICIQIYLQCQYVTLARQLRSDLRKSKARALHAEIVALTDAAPAGEILHCIRPFLGPTNPKKTKKACLPLVKDQEGNVCTTPEDAQNRWIQFFQHMEGGQRLTHADFRERWLHNLAKFLHIDALNVPLIELPSLVDLETAFRRVSIGKAIGMDGIPPELCRFKACDLARLTYSIMLKTCLYGQEAIEHKGGRLAIAWKHKGDPAECSSHRSLLVSSHLGKTIHRALRQKHHGLYTRFMQTQQLGGQPHMPVGVPLHMTRAFLRWQQRRKCPASVIFLDLTEAFYRVVRVLALGGELDDEHLAYIAHHLGYSPETLHEFAQQLSEPSAIAQAGAPFHVQRFMQALHTDTWFIIGDQADITRTEQGSRPGDSYADVVFGLLWAKLLRKYESKLIAADVLTHVPAIEYPALFDVTTADATLMPFLGPTWMDDLSVCISASTNSNLLAKTGTALSLLIDLCHETHMQPNLKKGKAEIMLCFRGHGSKELRRQFYSQNQGFPVVCEHKTYYISVVSRYLHLGGIIHHRTVTSAEITRRLGIAHQAFTQHRRLLYRNAMIPWKKRQEIFSTLVLSKLMYGFESWTFENLQCRAQLHAGIIKLYKRLLGSQCNEHLTDEAVIIAVGLPSPTELLRCSRLRYFGTLFRCGQAAHWGLLREDSGWISMLEDDCRWLWSQLSNNTSLPDPTAHFPVWQDLIKHHGGYWKKLIKKGVAHACLQRENEDIAVKLHHRVADVLHQHGWAPTLPSHEHLPQQTNQAFGCLHCQTTHATRAGESAHMFRRHGFRASARQLFDGTSCPNCLREYHTRAKVLAHLRHVHACRQSLIGRHFHCAPMPGTGSIIDRELHEATDGAVPFMHGEGPHLPTGRRQDFVAYDEQVLEAIYLCLVDLESNVEPLTALQAEIQQHPISWTTCCHTLQHFLETFTTADAEPLCVPYDVVISCIKALLTVDQWPFLVAGKSPDPLSKVRLDEWENWCADLAAGTADECREKPSIPRMNCRFKVVLHAYAGRRRRGDIEWYMNAFAKQFPDHIILTASVDIVIDSQFGDIAKIETRNYWLSHIKAGHVVAFIGGPPCNTWSKARNIDLGEFHGPRVVRSTEAPWGLPSLRLGELRQVMLGTLLLGFAFECMAALATCTGSGILEHPKDPEHPEYVSIWRLPILQLLLTLPRMRLISLSQGLFGAPSPKPTSLLVLGLATLEMDLHRHRLSGQLPQGCSIGKDSSGNYRTAPLKEYPPAFCQAVAAGLCKDLTSMDCSDFCRDPPPEFLSRCKGMKDVTFDGRIGHDG